jgi:tRNA(Ile)-lysidine synthase
LPAKADRAPSPAVVEAVKQFLSAFKTPGMILAAVSGGSDSKGLLLALHEAIAHGGFSAFSLSACTIDHGLRPESADEARAVARFCAERGIPHLTRRWQGEKPATGLQAAARGARYILLADAAEETGAQGIVTAHTADDQAETIAMRRDRSQPGALGLAGMADGMLVDRRVWVLRPFLRQRRADIRSYLTLRGEDWFDDPSNANPRFERVRVRQARQEDARLAIDQFIAAAEARRHSSTRAASLLERHAFVFEGLAARIEPVLAEKVSDPECRRAILSLTAVIGGRRHLPGRETAARLAAFLAEGREGRMTAGRVVFDRRRSGLYLYREARNLPDLVIQPHLKAIWDGRFIVTNIGAEPLMVGGGLDARELATRPIAAGLPEAIVKRAAKSAPVFSVAGEISSSSKPLVESSIGLYDTFLPRFDLMMANSIAALFGRDRYPAPPVHDVLTEKTG